MSEVSQDVRASARKIETYLRNRLAEMGQARVADKLNVHESTVSRWKDSDIERIALYLAALNLKVVPAGSDAQVFSVDEVTAMATLAKRAISLALEKPDAGGGL